MSQILSYQKQKVVVVEDVDARDSSNELVGGQQ